MRPSTASNRSGTGSSSSSPCHAVLLRWGGLMSVLDLARGAELVLADEVGGGGRGGKGAIAALTAAQQQQQQQRAQLQSYICVA
jgi:hypothetical protein